MRITISILAILLSLLSVSICHAESVCAKSCSSDSGPVAYGIDYCHIEDSTHQIFVLKVDLKAKGVVPFVNPKEKGMVTSKFASKYGVKVAINTAFFNSSGSLGYHKSNGESYGTDGYFTMGFDEKNVYYQGNDKRELMYNASSGSPELLRDGQKLDYGTGNFVTGTHPRTAVGIDKTGRYFYMVVVDGRRTKRKGMGLSTLADCLLALGVHNGVNMDGGGSSTMVVSGKVKNSPSDGHERSVTTHLGFFADDKCNPSEELCNEIDDDCDGQIDEDNVCCVPETEVCDGKDNDCDGQVDEDNVCCVPETEICDEKDNDCDGQVDEDNVCCVPEVCDGKDNDCDGQVDEDNVCCVPAEEICDQLDNDCDGEVDEGDVCCVPAEEICDQLDNDCDGEIDEGDVCCVPADEICDQLDNDCDGEIDEDDVCNSQEPCTPSEEICDQLDNDCDGKVDEDDVCNSQEPCTPSEEICDGKDNDCDGIVDENCDGGTDAHIYLESSSCATITKHPATIPGLSILALMFMGGLAALRRRRSK